MIFERAHHISEDGINEDVEQGWEDFQYLWVSNTFDKPK
jgi:hypothetical protein